MSFLFFDPVWCFVDEFSFLNVNYNDILHRCHSFNTYCNWCYEIISWSYDNNIFQGCPDGWTYFNETNRCYKRFEQTGKGNCMYGDIFFLILWMFFINWKSKAIRPTKDKIKVAKSCVQVKLNKDCNSKSDSNSPQPK